MSLTNAELKSKLGQPCEKRFVDLSDGEGLVARWSNTGKIAWYLRYRFQGKAVAFNLGSFPEMSLKDARVERSRCKALLSNGTDPRIDKKTKIDENIESQKMTVKRAFEYWFEFELPRRRSNPKPAMATIRKYIFPAIGDIPVDQCTTQHWMKAFRTMEQSPVLAGQTLGICKQAFKYCRITGFCRTDSLDDLRVSDVGKMANKRDRVLSRKELNEIWECCESVDNQFGNIKHKCIIAILMGTGARSGELRTAHITDFDLKEMVWTVPKERSKTKVQIKRAIEPRLVPFIELLIRLSTHKTLLLPDRGNRAPTQRTTFVKAAVNMCAYLGHPNWTAHTFRHTLATSFGDLLIDPFVAEKLLGHTMAGMMSVYNKGDYLVQQGKALETWMDYITTDKAHN